MTMRRLYPHQQRSRPDPSIEALEHRRLFSVVNVTPASNWTATIHNSRASDTIDFAAGTYALGRDTTLPNRTYIGASGATFTGSHNLNISGSDISGFTFDGVSLVLSGSGTEFHDNFVTGSSNLYVSGGTNNTRIVFNNFSTTTNIPLSGYPGDNVTVAYNRADLSHANTSGNDNNQEWLHFTTPCNSLSVSHNVITGTLMRWAIELQSGMTNLTVQDNYIHASEGGGGISCATGGDPTPPFAHSGENIEISGNAVLSDTPFGCALEVMGDKNVQIRNNYFGGFQTAILNGTGGENNQGLITADNVIIASDHAYSDGDNTQWRVPPRNSTGDQLYKTANHGAPAPPGAPAAGLGSESEIATDITTYVAATHLGNLTVSGTRQPIKGNTAAAINPTAAITVSAWVNVGAKLMHAPAAHRIVEKGSGTGQYRLSLAGNQTLQFALTGVGAVNASAPSAGGWHLLTGTYDGTTISLYADGQLLASAAASGRSSTSGGAYVIGGPGLFSRSRTASANQLLIDDARIYSISLTAAEVAELYTTS